MAHISNLWFAFRIWFLMEWNMAKRGFTPEEKAECWNRYNLKLDEIRAELERTVHSRSQPND